MESISLNSQLIRFARESSHVADFNSRNKLLTKKLLKYDLISKFQVGLKSDFVSLNSMVTRCKLKKIVGSNNFTAQFIKIIFQRRSLK